MAHKGHSSIREFFFPFASSFFYSRVFFSTCEFFFFYSRVLFSTCKFFLSTREFFDLVASCLFYWPVLFSTCELFLSTRQFFFELQGHRSGKNITARSYWKHTSCRSLYTVLCFGLVYVVFHCIVGWTVRHASSQTLSVLPVIHHFEIVH